MNLSFNDEFKNFNYIKSFNILLQCHIKYDMILIKQFVSWISSCVMNIRRHRVGYNIIFPVYTLFVLEFVSYLSLNDKSSCVI